jgi:hypothetical protein
MASGGQRPGFFDTFRVGWAPAKRVGGGSPESPRPAASEGGRKPSERRSRRRPSGTAAKGRKGAAANGAPTARKASPKLVSRREKLAHDYAQLQWDLGGIAYEMARRDHYRLEVLNAKAARLQEVDAELGQIERLLKLDEAGAVGACTYCDALQARGAVYCWRCGKELKIDTGTSPAAKPKAAASETAAKKPASGSTKPKTATLRRKSTSRRRSRPKGS